MIIHVDMDAFFASVEQRDDPRLQGKPVIVGGRAENRGVVAAANYAVREFGVHSAMPTATAMKLCPGAILLKPRIDYYGEISQHLRGIFNRYTPLVEPLALDEAFLDVSGSERLFGRPEQMAREIKEVIQVELDLVASVGVAPNKFLAKLASDLEKPDGLVVVREEEVDEFLDPLPVGRIWGVGAATGRVFDRLQIRTIGQLRERSLEDLRSRFGKTGEQIWRLARGIDGRKVVPDRQAKSISNETTFAVDIEDPEILESWLMDLSEQVTRRLRGAVLKSRTVHIKVRYDDFETITRSISVAEPIDSTTEVWGLVRKMMKERLPVRPLRVRLLGVGVSRLDRSGQTQGDLFDQSGGQASRLDGVTDEIRRRFGNHAVARGITSVRGSSRDGGKGGTELTDQGEGEG